MIIKAICRNNNNNIVPLKGERESFRLRQRGKNICGKKVDSFRFISYKESQKISKNKVVYPQVTWYSVAKL